MACQWWQRLFQHDQQNLILHSPENLLTIKYDKKVQLYKKKIACIHEVKSKARRKGYQATKQLILYKWRYIYAGYVNFRTEKYIGKERDHTTEHQRMCTVMSRVHMDDALLKYWMHLKMIILFWIVSKT
jgi:hypothetical protein